MTSALLPLVSLCALLLAAQAGFDADVVYRVAGGAELCMDIATPEGTGPFPAVVCLHGGGWSMGSRRSFHPAIREFAAKGMVAATVQYRLAPGAHHPAQVDDVCAAVSFLRRNAARLRIDASRMVLMGASAGAHLALVAGLRAPDAGCAVQAIVDVSGPTDLRDWRMNEIAEGTLRKTTGKTSDDLVADLLGTRSRSGPAVDDASPVLLVGPKSPPVLVIHWKLDQAVAMEQPERLLEELSKAKVPHEAVWLEGKGHALNGPGADQNVSRTIEFLGLVPAAK
jgi:acetyl esterase/lipase